MHMRGVSRTASATLAAAALAVGALAQEARERPRFTPPRGPQVSSPEVQEDGRVAFRILAPKAEAVLLRGTDIPDNPQGTPMTKESEGVWELTLGPLEPGPTVTTSEWTT
jgi:hypothetical protein